VCIVLVLWFFSPVIAAFGFLIMTIYHWGKSDLVFERYVLFPIPQFRGLFTDFNHALLRGMIPICVPFLAFPDQSIEFLAACIRLFSVEYMISFQELRFLVFPIFGVSFLIDQWIHLRKVRLRAAKRICIENILLIAFFGFIPPLLAIGCYFAGWHGLRHIIRLCHYEQKGARPDPAISEKIHTFAVQALPFTVISIFMLLGLLCGFGDRIPDAYEGVALYLVLISALTFPHLIIVEWMDRREVMRQKV
jgi:beta-carotene 15,15'-dioxygenase